MDLPLLLFFATLVAFGLWVGQRLWLERSRAREAEGRKAVATDLGLRGGRRTHRAGASEPARLTGGP